MGFSNIYKKLGLFAFYREPNEQHKNNNSRFPLVSWRTFVTGDCLKNPGKLSNRNAPNVHIFLVCLAFLVSKNWIIPYWRNWLSNFNEATPLFASDKETKPKLENVTAQLFYYKFVWNIEYSRGATALHLGELIYIGLSFKSGKNYSSRFGCFSCGFAICYIHF